VAVAAAATRRAGLLLLLATTPAGARADEPVTLTFDTMFYSDTDNVIVVSPQVGARAQVDDRGGEVAARVTVDVVTAASVDVITEATPRFTETREEVNLSGSHAFGPWLPSAHYRFSHEPDYVSHGGGVAVERRLGYDTTLSLGYDLTLDTVERSGTPSDVFSEPLTTHSFDASVTQVLGPRTVVRLAYSLVGQNGYMEKPYRYVPLFDQAGIDAAAADGVTLDADTFGDYRLAERPPEEVPDRRLRQALAVRFLRYLPSLSASARLDYRFYLDDWGMTAHTGELGARVATRIGEVALVNRLHWQSAVDFWRREYVVAPGTVPQYRTVDRELSTYLTDTVELGWTRSFGRLSVYGRAAAMFTRFYDFMFLDARTALTVEAGLRWAL
jgi:hypothetical protein